MAKNSQKGKNNKRKKIIVNTNVPKKSKSQKSIQEKRNKDSQKDDTEKKSFWTKFLSIFGIGRKKKNVTKNDEENVEKNNNESSNEKQRNGEDSIPKNGVGENSDKLQTAKDINEEKVEPQRDEKSSELAQDNEVEKTKDTKRKKFLFFWTIGSKKKKDTIPQNENESNRHSNTKNSYEEPLGPQKGNSPFDLGDEGYNQEDVDDKNINATLDQQPNDSSSSKSRAEETSEESKNIDDKDKEKVESENNAVEKSNEIAQNNEVENIKETKGEEVELKNNSDEVSTENTEDVKSIEKNKEDRNNDVSKDAKIKELEAEIKKYKGIEEEYDAIKMVLDERAKKMDKAPEKKVDLIKELLANLDEICSEKIALKAQNNELTGDLNEAKSEKSDLETRYKGVKSEKNGLESTIKEKENKIIELEAEINKMNNLEVGQLKCQLEDLKEECSNLKEAKDNLQKQFDDKEQELVKEKTKTTNLKNDLDVANKNLTTVKEELSNNKTVIKKLEAEKEKANKEITKLSESVDEVTAKNKKLESSIKEVSEENEANKNKVSRLEEESKKLNSRIEKLEDDNQKKKEKLETQKTHINKVQLQTKEKVIDTFNRLIVALEHGGYEKAIGDLVDACKDDEAFMLSRASELYENLKDITITEGDDANAILAKMSALVEADLDKCNDGFILPMARTCAYSYVPFILDSRGEDNIQLVKSKISIIETLITRLMGYFGVELIMPIPFVNKLEDGDFEKYDTISNLEYICPNARAHLERVDRKDKTNVIVDIVEVGYRINGEVKRKAKVIL